MSEWSWIDWVDNVAGLVFLSLFILFLLVFPIAYVIGFFRRPPDKERDNADREE